MSIDADFGLDLKIELGRVADRLERDAEDRNRDREILRSRVPAFFRLQNNGIIPTPTAPFGINFGGPDTGFEWVVRGIVVGGLTWGTTAAGTAEVYVTGLGSLAGTSSGTAGNISAVRALSDLVDQSSSLPNKAFYGRDQFVVKENESLVVVVVGGTAAQQYVAAVRGQVVRTPGWRGSAVGI